MNVYLHIYNRCAKMAYEIPVVIEVVVVVVVVILVCAAAITYDFPVVLWGWMVPLGSNSISPVCDID